VGKDTSEVKWRVLYSSLRCCCTSSHVGTGGVCVCLLLSLSLV
jgi:hypothetical protein